MRATDAELLQRGRARPSCRNSARMRAWFRGVPHSISPRGRGHVIPAGGGHPNVRQQADFLPGGQQALDGGVDAQVKPFPKTIHSSTFRALTRRGVAVVLEHVIGGQVKLSRVSGV